LFAGAAVAVGLANELEVPPTASVAWTAVEALFLAAILVPGLIVARRVRMYRFTGGCQVAAVGWGMQVFTGTAIVFAATGADMSGVTALLVSMLGMPTVVITGLVTVAAGAIRDRRH